MTGGPSRRRPGGRRRSHLRLVVPPPVDQGDILPPREAAGDVIAKHTEPYIRCGRRVIDMATDAIVATAAEHGLVGGPWDPEVIRGEVGEIVVRKLYHSMVLHVTEGPDGEPPP